MRREERKGCPVTWRSGTQPRQETMEGSGTHHLLHASSDMKLVAFHDTFLTTVTPWKGIMSRYYLFIPPSEDRCRRRGKRVVIRSGQPRLSGTVSSACVNSLFDFWRDALISVQDLFGAS